jgi:hypothetical protein
MRNLAILGGVFVAGVLLGFPVAASLAPGEARDIPLGVEIFHRLCTGVGGLGTVAALFYVVRQFRLLSQQSELLQNNVLASMDGQLYGRLDAFNRLIVEHEAEYEMLDTLRVGVEQPGHRAGLHHLCDLGFSIYEQVHKLHTRFGLLDSADWDEWRQKMSYFFRKTYVSDYWGVVRERYSQAFRDFADTLITRS